MQVGSQVTVKCPQDPDHKRRGILLRVAAVVKQEFRSAGAGKDIWEVHLLATRRSSGKIRTFNEGWLE